MEAAPPRRLPAGLPFGGGVGVGRAPRAPWAGRGAAIGGEAVPVFCRAAAATAEPCGEDHFGALPSGGAELRTDCLVAEIAHRDGTHPFAPRTQEITRRHSATAGNGKGNGMAEDKMKPVSDFALDLLE